jgi:hypothetical protein
MRKTLFVALAACLSLILPGGVLALSGLTGSQCQQSCQNTGASFDSNVNSSSFGNANEAFFFRAKNANSPNPGFTNGAVQLDDNAVLVQALVNNDSGSGSLARNTVLTITLPSGSAALQTATATISADNAGSVTDNVTFKDSQPFSLVFDQNASVFIAKRASSTSDYVNVATNNFRVNGNVMTVFMGDWAGGANQQAQVTVRLLVTRPSVQPVQPAAFVCTGLTRTPIDNNRSTFTASANGTAAAANISGFTFTVKDSSGRLVDTFTASTSSQSAAYNFNQAGSGSYTVTAVAGSDKGTTAVSSACTQTVTVPAVLSSATTAAANTPKPTALPNTGAGDVLGIFSGASAVGGAGHFLLRRYRR